MFLPNKIWLLMRHSKLCSNQCGKAINVKQQHKKCLLGREFGCSTSHRQPFFAWVKKKQEKSNWHGYLSTCLIAATIFENKLVNLQNIQVKFINSTLGSYSRIHSRTYSFISNMFLGQNTRETEHIASIPTGKKNSALWYHHRDSISLKSG